MHPWGKWGRNFVEYGVDAAHAALADAGLTWRDMQFVAGADTMRNGYPGYVVGRDVRPGAGLVGPAGGVVLRRVRLGSDGVVDGARAQILAGLCDVALVVGADTTPKGFLAPNAGDRPDDPDWLRFRLLGATNPTYFALYARRRMDLYGATEHDFAKVKVKNARHGLLNPNARYRKEVTEDEVLASPVVASPLHLLDICATSDGGAAVVVSSMEFARRHGHAGPVRVRGDLDRHADLPEHGHRDAELRHRLVGRARAGAADLPRLDRRRRVRRGGHRRRRPVLAEVYDLSSALELDWYENIGLCKAGEAERLHQRRRHHARRQGRHREPERRPACFGEAVPAQAIAQVCELVWQLRGQAGDRQVDGATAGVTVNQGLFGHGSSVVLST